MRKKFKTIKIFTISIVLIFCTAHLNGQAENSRKEKINAYISLIKQDTELNSEQEKQIADLLNKLYTERAKVKNRQGTNSKEKYRERKTAQESYEQELRKILTEKQEQEIKQKIDQRRLEGMKKADEKTKQTNTNQ